MGIAFTPGERAVKPVFPPAVLQIPEFLKRPVDGFFIVQKIFNFFYDFIFFLKVNFFFSIQFFTLLEFLLLVFLQTSL